MSVQRIVRHGLVATRGLHSKTRRREIAMVRDTSHPMVDICDTRPASRMVAMSIEESAAHANCDKHTYGRVSIVRRLYNLEMTWLNLSPITEPLKRSYAVTGYSPFRSEPRMNLEDMNFTMGQIAAARGYRRFLGFGMLEYGLGSFGRLISCSIRYKQSFDDASHGVQTYATALKCGCLSTVKNRFRAQGTIVRDSIFYNFTSEVWAQ